VLRVCYVGRYITCLFCGEDIYKYIFGIQASEIARVSTDLKIGKYIESEWDVLIIYREEYEKFRNIYWLKIVPNLLRLNKKLRKDDWMKVMKKEEDAWNKKSEYERAFRVFCHATDYGFYRMAHSVFEHFEYHILHSDYDFIVFIGDR